MTPISTPNIANASDTIYTITRRDNHVIEAQSIMFSDYVDKLKGIPTKDGILIWPSYIDRIDFMDRVPTTTFTITLIDHSIINSDFGWREDPRIPCLHINVIGQTAVG